LCVVQKCHPHARIRYSEARTYLVSRGGPCACCWPATPHARAGGRGGGVQLFSVALPLRLRLVFPLISTLIIISIKHILVYVMFYSIIYFTRYPVLTMPVTSKLSVSSTDSRNCDRLVYSIYIRWLGVAGTAKSRIRMVYGIKPYVLRNHLVRDCPAILYTVAHTRPRH
jgi:hypothetical protein